MKEIRYQCFNCFLVFRDWEMIEDECPGCHTHHLVKKMCENDTGICTCIEDVKSSVVLCPICNEPMCPNDGSHDVVGVSRVKSEKICSY